MCLQVSLDPGSPVRWMIRTETFLSTETKVHVGAILWFMCAFVYIVCITCRPQQVALWTVGCRKLLNRSQQVMARQVCC